MVFADVPGMRPKGTSIQLEQRRRQAVELLKQGHNPTQVARMVGADNWSVTRWKHAYDKGGETALAGKPHPGRRPKLTRRKLGQLAGMLLKGARHYGYSTDLWTLSRVAEVIEDHWGVTYHPGHVWKLLLLMKWSCQKPERRARERNEEAIAGWRREDWPRIKKRPKKRAKRRVS